MRGRGPVGNGLDLDALLRRQKMGGQRKKYKGIKSAFLLILSVIVSAALFGVAKDAFADEVERGKEVYQKYCTICHGAKGDGKGLVGIIHRFEKKGLVWSIYPRDLTVGTFKFRSTPTGCLPTDEDLSRIIMGGILRSGMPSHADVAEKDRDAVREYIKTLSPRWEEEDPCDPLPIAKPDWVGNPSSIEKGEKVYKDMKCFECHGYEGMGDGPKSGELKDDWGDQIVAFDFTSGTLKRGSTPENVYITFVTGLDGTGMPSYEDSLEEEDRWHLVSFTLKLMGLAQ
jgi:mono/diheme cytochrome c family protein